MSEAGFSCRLRRGFFSVVLCVLGVVAAAPRVFAQCATCYTAASAAGEKGMRAIDMGILILLFPALLLFVSVLLLLRRRAAAAFAREAELPRFQALPSRDPFSLT
jgi:hypothetical protein